MSALDTLADKAQAASERLAREGGLKAKLAHELADDAVFLRKLKPELLKKRAKGNAPTVLKPEEPRSAPGGPQLDERPKPAKKGSAGGPNPFLVVGAALVLGIVVAKWIDTRGHAHPRW
jgi:anti-sigma factor RsiW